MHLSFYNRKPVKSNDLPVTQGFISLALQYVSLIKVIASPIFLRIVLAHKLWDVRFALLFVHKKCIRLLMRSTH